MAKKVVIRGGVNLLGGLGSGLGDPILTRDETSKEVGKIPPIDTTSFVPTNLPDGYILIGNSSNVATPRQVTGMLTLSDIGTATITANTITNAHINGAAGISYSKLNLTNSIVNNDISAIAAITRTKIANGNIWRVLINNGTGVFSEASAITGSRLLISDVNGIPTHSSVTATEASYLSNVTGPIQPQINNRLLFSSAIIPSTGDIVYFNGSNWMNLARGTTGQVLTATSTTINWANGTSNGLPVGGTAGQYLNKIDGTNYNAQWSTLNLAKITDVTALAADVNLLQGLAAAGLTNTELGYVNGVTNPIQTQLENKLNNSLPLNSLFVGDAANHAIVLPPGLANQVLTIVAGAPIWADPTPPGNVSGVPTTVVNTIVRWNDTGATSIKGSNVTIDNSDNITGVTSLTTINQGAIILRELTASGTNTVSIRASGTMAGDYVITLPAAAPTTNDYLKFDGTNYVWAAAGGGGGGTVTSVTGTANRITSTGGTTPIIDISAAYVGQTSLTTLGTVTTGTWNAGVIPLLYGGTGAALTAPGADRIFFYDQSAGSTAFLTIGTGLTITGTTLAAGLVSTPGAEYFAGDNTTTIFTLSQPSNLAITMVTVGGYTVREGVHYSKNNTTKQVTFAGGHIPTSAQTVGIYYLTSASLGTPTLANGNMTTANGSAIDIGGTITADFETPDSADNTHNISIGGDIAGTAIAASTTISGYTLNLLGYGDGTLYAVGSLQVIAGAGVYIGDGSSTVDITVGSDATGDIHYRNSLGHFTRRGIGTTGQVLTVSGGLPIWANPASAATITLSGDVSGSGTTSITTTIGAGKVTSSMIANNAVGNAQFRQANALSVIGNPIGATNNVQDISPSATGDVLRHTGTNLAFGKLDAVSLNLTTNKIHVGVANVASEMGLSTGLAISGSNVIAATSIASTEIGAYNGSVMAGSGLASPSTGNFDMGLTASTGGTTRTITAKGTGADLDLTITPKGTGSVIVNANNAATKFRVGAGSFFLQESSGVAEIRVGDNTNINLGLRIITNNGDAGNINGYPVAITAGGAHSSGNGNGGSIDLTSGVANGSGADGRITINSRSKSIRLMSDATVDNSAKGFILKSPDGNYWRGTISNAGAVTWTSLGTTLP